MVRITLHPALRSLRRIGAASGACLVTVLVLAHVEEDEPPRVRTPNCTASSCHLAQREHAFAHALATLPCQSCHEYTKVENHWFRLAKPDTDMCVGCHQQSHDRVIHQPVKEKNCLGCHDPHGSDVDMQLRLPTTDGLCLLCHDQRLIDAPFVHGPVAVQACVLCHDAHSSNIPGLLTMSPDRMCLDCHAEIEPTGIAARRQHQPMEDGCGSCHDPHSSDAPHQLLARQPNLCFNCHEGVRNDVAAAAFRHQPVEAAGGCSECHDPHFTILPRLQKLPQPELCLTCHDREMTASDGRTLTNMALLLEENPNHHGPIREGDCALCHHPHAATNQNLLHQEYPAEFYAPYSEQQYALCFSCHISDLVKDESGTGLTQFRDGDRNLHWLHVNLEKGRTCRACHEVHASRRPAHIREAVPFGKSNWMLEINFKQTDEGGSCLPGCHKLRAYNRTAPANPIRAESAGRSSGEGGWP